MRVTVRRFTHSDEARPLYDWRVHGFQRLPHDTERPFSVIGNTGHTLQSALEKAIETAKLYQARAANPIGGHVEAILKNLRRAR